MTAGVTVTDPILAAVDSKRALAGEVVRGVHGKANTFRNWGCRCPACRDASQADLARRNQQGTGPRRGVRPAPTPRIPAAHGTAARYHKGCHCPECTAAHTEAGRTWRANRSIPPTAPKGTTS